MNHTSIWLRAGAWLLAASLILGSFAACGKPAAEEPAAETTSAVQEETVAETTAETTSAEEEAETEATEQETEKAEESTEAAADETTEEVKKVPQTKEEILALYNESANPVKYGAKSVVSNYTLNSQTSDATLSNKVLQNIANKLISANMGYDKKKDHVTYTGKDEIRQNFPARGQDWVSKLTVSDLTNATCTEKDGIYTVTLSLVPDTTPNIKQGEGHAGKGFSIITKDQIVEGAGSLGMSVIQEDSIKLTFKNCKLTAKIDAQTGKLLSANYYIDWTLALTALGIDVAVSFGSEDDYSINW